MCKCDFSGEEYLDAVAILHPIYPDALLILLGEYVYTSERTPEHTVLGNVRHKNLVEFEDSSVFQVQTEKLEMELPMRPIIEHLLDHPEDCALVHANLDEGKMTWRALKKSEKGKL